MQSLFRLIFCLAAGIVSLSAAAQDELSFEGTVINATEDTQAAEDLPATEREVASPADIWDRIRRGFQMPAMNTRRAKQALKLYARDPEYIRRVTERAGKYLYHIVEEVELRGMPTELALLPFVESAFQPEALSYAKASGLWQFMPTTGSIYSLQQNLWKDERRDVLESTRAALDYLNRLHTLFGDWQLALAAYNWGEGSVSRAIRRAKARGQKTDYVHLRMPRETAWYVPKLMAVREIIEHPEQYGVTLPDIENSPYFVRITKSRDIDLDTAARLAEMEPEDFKLLNPGFNLPVIVASHNSYILLPIDRVAVFMDNLASWVDTGKPLSSWALYHTQAGETLLDVANKTGMTEDDLRRINRIPRGRRILAGSALLVDAGGQDAPAISEDELNASLKLSEPEVRRIVYRVRRGDTLYEIAARFGVTQKSLRTANRLRTSQLRIGQRLIIVVSPKAKRPRSALSRAACSRKGKVTYSVRRGDTLSSIARRYGTSIARIKNINSLASSRLRVGQCLVIRR